MKKVILSFIIVMVLSFICGINVVNAEEASPAVIKKAIEKYKAKNYAGSISDLQMVVSDDPSSVISWYYLANSYMNIAMKTEAHEAFDKVIQLNTVPQLTSYSIQAKLCMDNPARCNYQKFSPNQIKELIANPNIFLEDYFAKQNGSESQNRAEIEKLINGKYMNNIHPSAKTFIDQEQAKVKQYEINDNRAYMPDNTRFAMYLESMNNDKTKNDEMIDLLRYYQNLNNRQLSPEVIQMMMMNNSLNSF